mmetsp:Transcript_53605/g.149116  ORF Transcript_53605/g.149116 Transcript_53605/m.149116 type:complete len:324 (-) Transcript_53605:604-1575(-)
MPSPSEVARPLASADVAPPLCVPLPPPSSSALRPREVSYPRGVYPRPLASSPHGASGALLPASSTPLFFAACPRPNASSPPLSCVSSPQPGGASLHLSSLPPRRPGCSFSGRHPPRAALRQSFAPPHKAAWLASRWTPRNRPHARPASSRWPAAAAQRPRTLKLEPPPSVARRQTCLRVQPRSSQSPASAPATLLRATCAPQTASSSPPFASGNPLSPASCHPSAFSRPRRGGAFRPGPCAHRPSDASRHVHPCPCRPGDGASLLLPPSTRTWPASILLLSHPSPASTVFLFCLPSCHSRHFSCWTTSPCHFSSSKLPQPRPS